MLVTDNQKRALGTIVRFVLLLAAGPLIRGHVISTQILDPALDDLVQQIVGWILAGGVLTWSLLQKWLVGKKIAIAATLPAGSTEHDINAVVKVTNPGLARIP